MRDKIERFIDIVKGEGWIEALKRLYLFIYGMYFKIASIGFLALLYDFLRSKCRFSKINRSFSHLDCTFFEALIGFVLTKIANRRLIKNFYRERFIIVFGQPKSASRLFVRLITQMAPKSYHLDRLKTTPYLPNFPYSINMDVSPEILKFFPKGGIFHTHAVPRPLTIETLKSIKCKHVITIRHPLDDIIANYCHRLRHPKTTERAIKKNELSMLSVYYPIDPKVFLPGVPLADALDHLIKDGFLFAILSWITDWLLRRDLKKSFVIRYEDLFLNQSQTLDKINQFITSNDLANSIKEECVKMIEPTAEQIIHRSNKSIFPCGWTGKVGVYKNYCSKENIANYKTVVNNFLVCYPNANLLNDFYPNLLDLDNSFKKSVD